MFFRRSSDPTSSAPDDLDPAAPTAAAGDAPAPHHPDDPWSDANADPDAWDAAPDADNAPVVPVVSPDIAAGQTPDAQALPVDDAGEEQAAPAAASEFDPDWAPDATTDAAPPEPSTHDPFNEAALVDEPPPARPCTLDELLIEAINQGASDLMLTPDKPPMLKLDGAWHPTHWEPLTADATREHLAGLLQRIGRSVGDVHTSLDVAFEDTAGHRFRVNVFRHRGNLAAVLRVIPQTILSFEELGLPGTLRQLASERSGLVLVTGATGHGKSTTLAAFIDVINRNYDRHIITLEDPIEFVHEDKRSIIHQREISQDADTFAEGLRAALRQSPDVILVGELRDLEAISAAVTAAETGHLVLGTLHTNGAKDTIDRIIDVFPAGQQAQVRYQLASALRAVLSQVLIPSVGGGRVLAYELMLINNAISSQIRTGNTHQVQTTMQTSRKEGMVTLEHCLRDLHERNEITYEQAMLAAHYRESLEKLIREGAGRFG